MNVPTDEIHHLFLYLYGAVFGVVDDGGMNAHGVDHLLHVRSNLLFELVTVRLVVVHRLEDIHAVLRQVFQLALLLFLHRRCIRILLDVREALISSQHLIERTIDHGVVIEVSTRYDVQGYHQEHPES